MAVAKEFDPVSYPYSSSYRDFYWKLGQEETNFGLLVWKGSVHCCCMCDWIPCSILPGGRWEPPVEPDDRSTAGILHSDPVFSLVLDMERFN